MPLRQSLLPCSSGGSHSSWSNCASWAGGATSARGFVAGADKLVLRPVRPEPGVGQGERPLFAIVWLGRRPCHGQQPCPRLPH